MTLIFDGHNDILLRLWMNGDAEGKGFVEGMDTHIDANKAKAGGLAGGFFAIFTPQQNATGEAILGTDPITMATAQHATDAMIATFQSLCRAHPQIIRQCHNKEDIEAAMAAGIMAAVLHIEGAEAIAPDLSNLDHYYQQGLRSIGPVWSRSNAFGHGVPFDFPGSPDQGTGLTQAGKNLIRACDEMGIMIDLSHLNEAGFWNIASLTSRPLIATHSNAHALSPSPRNLTDQQLTAIAESGGLVGLNFASGFLREDGEKTADTALEVMIRHLDHLLDHLGEDGVALGSDFDGAVIPKAIGTAAGLPNLITAMTDAGYGKALIAKICHQNWLNMIAKQIG
jgi:membrane dipeptidase